MKFDKMVQQGDVLVKTAEGLSLPKDAKPVEPQNGRLILAEGEVTGHAHAIPAGIGAQLFSSGGMTFLEVKGEKPVTLTHEEHGAVEVDPGVHVIGIVKEYDYFEEEARNVAD